MSFSVIVPVLNQPNYTKVCLDSLLPSGCEIVVIDNGSLSVTRRLLDSYGAKIKVLRLDRNVGNATSLNLGVQKATHDRLIFLHNDCVMPLGWEVKAEACFQAMASSVLKLSSPYTNYSDEEKFVLSRALRDQFIAVKPSNKSKPSHTEILDQLKKVYPNGLKAFADALNQPILKASYQVSSFCILTTKESFMASGWFTGDYPLRGAEEKQLLHNYQDNGWNAGIAGFYVHHFGNITSDSFGFNSKKMLRANYEYFQERCRSHIRKPYTAVVFPDRWPELAKRAVDNLKSLPFPPAQIIEIPPPGIFPFKKVWEWALPQISCEFVLQVDGDMLFHDTGIDTLLRHITTQDNVACVAAQLLDPCVGPTGYAKMWRTSALSEVTFGKVQLDETNIDVSYIEWCEKLGHEVVRTSEIVGKHAIMLDPYTIFRAYFRRGVKQVSRKRIGTPAQVWGIENAMKVGSRWSHLAMFAFHCGVQETYEGDTHDPKWDEFAQKHYQKVRDFCEGLVYEERFLSQPKATTDSRTRVALLCNHLGFGGMEMFAYLFDSLVDRSRFDVFVYSRASGPLESAFKGTVRIASEIDYVSQMRRWICEDQIDVAILVSLFPADEVIAPPKLCRVIDRVDGIDLLQAKNHSLVDVSVFQSQKIMAQASFASKCAYIQNGRDLSKFARNAAARQHLRERLQVGDNVLIATVGRLCAQKNHTKLIGAAQELISQGVTNFKVAIMGPDWGLKYRLEQQAKPISDHVAFLEAGLDAPADLLSAADIFVLPSLHEGLPGVLIEACAAGLPVIATDVGAASDLVKGNGFLVQPEGNALIDSLRFLLQNRAERERLGSISLDISKNYDAKPMVKAYEALIAEQAGIGKQELPKITILMPIWNRAKFLAQAIDSVLGQTSGQWRLLISVDDLVPCPEIQAILAKYSDPRISVIYSAHRGVSSALNAGIRSIKTDYIMRLDSDDLLEPMAVETMLKQIQEHPFAGYFYSSKTLVNEGNDPIDINGLGSTRIARDFSIRELEEAYYTSPLITWKRQDLMAIGGFCEDMPACEDYMLALLMAANGTRFQPVKEFLYRIRYHDNHLSQKWTSNEQRSFNAACIARYKRFKTRLQEGNSPL